MGAHVAHQLDAVALLQADVGNHHIRAQFLDQGARIAGGLRLAAHRQVLLVLHHTTETLANDRMIVDDEDTPRPALATAQSRRRGRRTHPCITSAHIHFLHKWRGRIVAHQVERVARP